MSPIDCPLRIQLSPFDGTTPTVAESAYIDERAVVIGDGTVGENASAVLRGDVPTLRLDTLSLTPTELR